MGYKLTGRTNSKRIHAKSIPSPTTLAPSTTGSIIVPGEQFRYVSREATLLSLAEKEDEAEKLHSPI